jgi:hypothetical protein
MFFRRRKESNPQRSRNGRRPNHSRRLGFERLEDRELLAIMWMNQGVGGNNADNFNILGDNNREIARSIVARAVADWNAVLTNFNYAEDSDTDPNNNLNNTFNLTVVGDFLGTGSRGQVEHSSFSFSADGSPRAATVQVDNDGGSYGWFFDTTPNDDAEFTGIVNSGSTGTEAAFAAGFVDVNGSMTAGGSCVLRGWYWLAIERTKDYALAA